MTFTDKQIKHIAEELETGFHLYWNIKTNEQLFLPDIDGPYFEESCWEEELKKIKKLKKDFILIAPPSSHIAFGFMEEFIETLDNDPAFQERLVQALQRKKPFREFKDEIDHSDYREKWFEFKSGKFMEYVKKQLEEIM